MTAAPIASHPTPRRAGWLVVGLLLLVQFALFRESVAREVASNVPLDFDQTSFLWLSYRVYDAALDDGPLAGLREAWRQPSATGCLLSLQGGICFLVMGPARLAALLPLFIYFAGLQCFVVAVLLRWTRRWEVALFGLGLLACAGSPLHWQGGLRDFRIDSIAFSLYGMLLGCYLLSDGFASRRWSLAVAGVANLLLLYRYLTAVYLVGIASVWLAAVLLWLVWMRRDDPARALLLARLRNALLSCALFAVVLGVVVAARWKELWQYYGVGHLTGDEKHLRAAEAGVFTTSDSLLFYARSVWNLHAGWIFFAVAGLGVLVALWLRRGASLASDRPRGWAVSLVVLGLVVPWLVLTANTAKSPVVANVLVPALLWLFLLPLARLSLARPSWLLRGVMVVALAAGMAVQLDGYCQREPRFGKSPEDRQQLLAMHDDLARRAQREGWSAPVVSCDVLTDYLPPNTLGIVARERQGMRLDVQRGVGASIFPLPDEVVQRTIEVSHFVVLHEEKGLTYAGYPAGEALDRLRPWMQTYCTANLEAIGHYVVLGKRCTLYARPSLRPVGANGGWITSRGLTLHGRAETLRQFPRVRLSGDAMPVLPRTPKVEVRLGGRTIPARVSFPDPLHYVVDFDVPEGAVSGDGAVELTLKFDAHFVPRDLGMNDDVRELVVRSPSQIELQRRGEVGMTGNLNQPPPLGGR